MGTVNNLKNLKTPHTWGVFDQACYIITNINCAHLSLKLNSLHLRSLLTWTAPSPPWPLHIYTVYVYMRTVPGISLFVLYLIVLLLQLYLPRYSISAVWLPMVFKLNLAAVQLLSLRLCQREPVSRGIVSSCCLLYIWKWLTCLSPAYKVDVFFFFSFALYSSSFLSRV